jgi:DNA-binding GntR family transcriptional regulator
MRQSASGQKGKAKEAQLDDPMSKADGDRGEPRSGRIGASSAAQDALPDVTADKLRAMIVRGTIAPGTHLGQSELTRRFGMSKVPIREALKLLATEGLLRHDRNRGFFVAELDVDEAVQLYKLRRWLEAELLRTTRWPNRAEIAAFRKRFRRLEEERSREHRANWATDLADLRYDIFDLSPQKLLLREARRLWSLTDRYRALFPRERSSPELALVEALAERDRDELLRVYHHERDRVEELLRQSFEDISARSLIRR